MKVCKKLFKCLCAFKFHKVRALAKVQRVVLFQVFSFLYRDKFDWRKRGTNAQIWVLEKLNQRRWNLSWYG